MKMEAQTFLFSFLVFGMAGAFAEALSYDYTFINDCLADPVNAQYNGGIIANPQIKEGLKGWTAHGNVKIKPQISKKGNHFLVAYDRKQPYDSASQKVLLEKDHHYTFSAWIQVSKGKNVPITAIFKTTNGFKIVGSVVAQAGCWSMLKTGITVDTSGPAEFYFQSNDTSIDIWVDSVSLQPFTKEQWRSHQEHSIEKIRKKNVKFQVLDAKGRPVPYANISINQNKPGFPFGAAINKNILNNAAYQNWFCSRFKVTTFENEMKWYSTEATQGKEDYSVADAMLGFTSQHGISVRGHNIFWDDPKYQQNWVNGLSSSQLQQATDKRLKSIVSKYAGKVIAWDVENENLHFNFYESKLGYQITGTFFQKTHQIDGNTTLFFNDYNTIEDNRDGLSSPSRYLQKIGEVRGVVGNGVSIGIGLEGHFDTPNIPYMRSAIDTLASAGLPIWITELDVSQGPNQASYLEQILREAYAHPAIKGIVIWAPWTPQGCYRMCLTDNNFKNLPTGDVVDKLFNEWGHRTRHQAAAGIHAGTTDAHGFFNASLFHGDYEVKYFLQQQPPNTLQKQPSNCTPQKFRVDDVDHPSEKIIKIIA